MKVTYFKRSTGRTDGERVKGMKHQCDKMTKNFSVEYVQYPDHGEWIAFENCTDGENLIYISFCPYCGQQLTKGEQPT